MEAVAERGTPPTHVVVQAQPGQSGELLETDSQTGHSEVHLSYALKTQLMGLKDPY